jgi:hypothetical protein
VRTPHPGIAAGVIIRQVSQVTTMRTPGERRQRFRVQDEPSRLRSFVGLDLHLMAHVVNVPLQKVRDLLDRGAERETVPKLGNVNRGPGSCMLSAHGQPLSAYALRALPIRAGA